MTTTYTPERQMFPPGTKVKAVCHSGTTYEGIVADATARFSGGDSLSQAPYMAEDALVAFWDDGPGTEIKSYITRIPYARAKFTKLEDPKKELQPMQFIKSAAATVRDYVKPYEKYLVAAALLLALDHFVLKGAMADRIQRLAQSLADRLASMVDGLIAKIGGGE